MANAIVQYGAQGTNAKILQQMLKRHGYNVDVDGIFGDNTLAAVNDFQKKYGLAVDGIVGQDTWQALAGETQTTSTTPATNPNTKGANTTTTTPTTTTPTTNTGTSGASGVTNLRTPVSAPTVAALPTQPKYDTTSWDDTTKGKNALDAYNTAKEAVTNFGNFTYGNEKQLTDLITKILNRDKFTYDLNGDALYQQYKDKYIQQGKMAMGDAIGQASAMTGGYGNSYAQSVGQQAYQAQLQNLNDIVPELYQMALDKYNMEGQDLYNQYGMLSDDYTREYGVWNDKYGRAMDALGIAQGDYYNGADIFHTEQSNKNSVAGKEFDDAMAIWNANTANAWQEAEWNRDQTWRDEDIKREDERLKVEDDQWQAQFDAVYGNKDTTTTTTEPTKNLDNRGKYDNGNLTIDQVKALQKALGVEVDGLYGAGSKEAAGGLSAEEAYNKFIGNPQPQKGYSNLEGELNTYIAGGASKSEISAFIRGAVAEGEITQSQAQKLLSTYVPRGYTY